eukprot:1402496-Amphidinium_carterae.1
MRIVPGILGQQEFGQDPVTSLAVATASHIGEAGTPPPPLPKELRHCPRTLVVKCALAHSTRPHIWAA